MPTLHEADALHTLHAATTIPRIKSYLVTKQTAGLPMSEHYANLSTQSS